jgi:hypothetical protein
MKPWAKGAIARLCKLEVRDQSIYLKETYRLARLMVVCASEHHHSYQKSGLTSALIFRCLDSIHEFSSENRKSTWPG